MRSHRKGKSSSTTPSASSSASGAVHHHHSANRQQQRLVTTPSSSAASPLAGLALDEWTTISQAHASVEHVHSHNNNNNNVNKKHLNRQGSSTAHAASSSLDPADLASLADPLLVGVVSSTTGEGTQAASSSATAAASSASSSSSMIILMNTGNNTPFHMSWSEVMALSLAIMSLVTLSIFVGVAAGIAISVHYFERQAEDPTTVMVSYYWDPAGLNTIRFRSTQVFPEISWINSLHFTSASGNGGAAGVDVLDHHHYHHGQNHGKAQFALGHVVYTAPSGRQSILMVVEESPPLQHHALLMGDNNLLPSLDGASMLNDNNSNISTGSTIGNQLIQPPRFKFGPRTQPVLCSDGETMGYNSWNDLKNAVLEANAYSAEKFARWRKYFAHQSPPYFFEDDSLYYEEDIVLTICPGVTLRERKGPIYINADHVVIECVDCVVDVGGTHFAFGPDANNVVVRGITFTHAHTSSLAFYSHGAEASFEDCRWHENSAVHAKVGSVADVNATAIVNFYRCFIGKVLPAKQGGFVSSLSIRQPT